MEPFRHQFWAVAGTRKEKGFPPEYQSTSPRAISLKSEEKGTKKAICLPGLGIVIQSNALTDGDHFPKKVHKLLGSGI